MIDNARVHTMLVLIESHTWVINVQKIVTYDFPNMEIIWYAHVNLMHIHQNVQSHRAQPTGWMDGRRISIR